jgi:cyclase
MHNPKIYRFIPVLTISGGQLVKTLQFKNPKYLGDPINAIKIFNAKEVDELVILDLDASRLNKLPNYTLIKEMASEAFMPIAYGGGVCNIDIAKKIIKCGVEKIVLNTALYKNESLVREIGDIFGSQSLVASLDYRWNLFGNLKLVYRSGSRTSNFECNKFLKKLQELGIGEILLQNIKRDGTFDGYDFKVFDVINSEIDVPIVMLGGASSLQDMHAAVFDKGAHASAASSIFMFKNKDRNSILINYGK